MLTYSAGQRSFSRWNNVK